MTTTVTIIGYVYKDEDGDSRYDPSNDIPIVGATVTVTVSNNETAQSTTDNYGKYVLNVSPEATYYLDVSLPTGLCSYDPDNGDWSNNHSTITGQQTVNVPSNSTQQINVDIAVNYSYLNYHPESEQNFTYRIWHAGPIFKGKPNTILVHGAVVPEIWDTQTKPNTNIHFLNLGQLLRSKAGGQHNVWEFEYADECKDNMAHTGCANYGDLNKYVTELIETINLVRSWNPGNNINIIAHSMGGLIARGAVQDPKAGNVDKIITLDTGHFGFNLAEYARYFSDQAVVKEVAPGSKFVYDLCKGFQNGQHNLLSLAAHDLLMGLGIVSWTSSRLVEVSNDGSTRYDHDNTPFSIVNGVNHMSIAQINNVTHPAFAKIQDFFEGRQIDQQELPSGSQSQVDTYFTVVLGNELQSDPKLLLNGKPVGQIVDRISNDEVNQEYHAVVFNVDIDPPYQDIQIEYASNKREEGQLTKKQSSIRLDVLPN